MAPNNAKGRRLQRLSGRRRKEDATTPSPTARTTLLQAANHQEDVSPTLLPKMPRHLIGEDGRMQHGLTTFVGNPCSGAPTASSTVPNNAGNTSSGRRHNGVGWTTPVATSLRPPKRCRPTCIVAPQRCSYHSTTVQPPAALK